MSKEPIRDEKHSRPFFNSMVGTADMMEMIQGMYIRGALMPFLCTVKYEEAIFPTRYISNEKCE